MPVCRMCGPMACGSTQSQLRDDSQRPHWPPTTTYQDDFGKQQMVCPVCMEKLGMGPQMPGASQHSQHCQVHQQFPLIEPTPVPLLDKHINGATYQVRDPMGVMVTEERVMHPQAVPCRVLEARAFTPNYRYREWVSRPVIELVRDQEYVNPLVCLPAVSTQHLDFYHEERMSRPSPGLRTSAARTVPVRVLPIPQKEDMPSLHGIQ